MSQGRHSAFPDVPAVALAEAAAKGEQGLERRFGEGEQAYKAFVQYCMLGPLRTLGDVAEAVGRSRASVTKYRIINHWKARIEEWWRQRKEREGCSREVVPAAGEPISEEWEKRRDDWRKREWELHMELMSIGQEAAARWRGSDKVPSLTELARIFELASRLARLASGLPLNSTEVSGNVEMPIRVEIEAALERAYGREVIDVETVEPAKGLES